MTSSIFHIEPAREGLNVGMDLDGVHDDFDRSYFDAMLVLRPDHPGLRNAPYDPVLDRSRYRKAQTWDFYADLYGQTYEEFKQVCNDAVDLGLIFNGDHWITGGLAAWNDLRAQGHKLHIITARSFGTHPIASQVATRTALRRAGFKYDSLTFSHNKLDGPEVHIMLEDNLDNYDQLESAGVEAWLFDQPWNQDNGRRRRVYNHDEFVRRVNALAARRSAAAAAREAQRQQNADLAQRASQQQLRNAQALEQKIARSDLESDLADA